MKNYEEPKLKVKEYLWQYVVEAVKPEVITTMDYRTDEEAIKSFGSPGDDRYLPNIRLDWTTRYRLVDYPKYRLLSYGETIKKTDEIFEVTEDSPGGTWVPLINSEGMSLLLTSPVRRKVEET